MLTLPVLYTIETRKLGEFTRPAQQMLLLRIIPGPPLPLPTPPRPRAINLPLATGAVAGGRFTSGDWPLRVPGGFGLEKPEVLGEGVPSVFKGWDAVTGEPSDGAASTDFPSEVAIGLGLEKTEGLCLAWTGELGLEYTRGFGLEETGGFGLEETGGFGLEKTGGFGLEKTEGFGLERPEDGFGLEMIGGFGGGRRAGLADDKDCEGAAEGGCAFGESLLESSDLG